MRALRPPARTAAGRVARTRGAGARAAGTAVDPVLGILTQRSVAFTTAAVDDEPCDGPARGPARWRERRGAADRRGRRAGAGAVQVRARPVGHRRHHRPARAHHLRQRQVLRDFAVPPRRADRPGPPHRSTPASIPRSSSATCGGRSRRAASGAARSATGPRTARSTGSTRRSCRSSTMMAGSRGSISRSATTSRSARRPRRAARSGGAGQLGELAASSPTRCGTRWRACAARCRSLPRACRRRRGGRIIGRHHRAHRRAERARRRPPGVRRLARREDGSRCRRPVWPT